MWRRETRGRESLLSRLAADLPGRERFDEQKSFLEEVGMLLNSRYPANEIPDEYQYASESILAYGLPDASDKSLLSGQAKSALAMAIQNTLRIFEPRLSSVRVSVEASEPGTAATVFCIEAILRLRADSEPIMIEVKKESSGSRFAIRNRL